jgi:DNA repair exonuclease SbcCD ATPase subunit
MVELLKLGIEGFGKFDKTKVINFKKGINFITGLNEAGKSTILEAILASLFKYTNTKIKQFFCWTNGDVCKLSLTYKTDKGEIFQIISDYKNAKKKLVKITKSGKSEISTTINTIHQYIKEHFGFDEQKVFENTTFIRQSQMAILGDSTTKNKLRDMIEEVLVGSAEASATKALKKIKKVAKDCKKEAELLNEDLDELKEELETAEENKRALNEDSSEFEEISKNLTGKQKRLNEFRIRKERFDKKEEHKKEYEILDKEIKNIDKLLSSINDSVKKREKLIDRLVDYKGFDSISKQDFSVIKDLIRQLENIQASLKAYTKSGGKRQVVQERLDIKYVALFIIGLLFSVVIIGIPLAIYAYKRMKKEVTIEEPDTKTEDEIKKLNENKEELEKELRDNIKEIKDFDTTTFVDLFSEYTEIKNKIDGLTESISEFIKNILERDEITNDEEENIRKIRNLKTDLLNKLTIAKNNLDKYKLVNLTDKDIDELESLEEEVKELNDRKVELKTSVNKTKELVKSPEEIKEEVDAIENKIRDLLGKSEEHELASFFLEKSETEVQQKFTPSIEKDSKPILKKVTNNKYSDLKINEEDLNITVKAPEINEFVPVDILSQGAKDQIYFTIRTTMTDLLSGNINIPLIFDDPFHNFDDVRLGKTISAVKELSKNKQIILISHKQYQKDFKNFAKNVIEVK